MSDYTTRKDAIINIERVIIKMSGLIDYNNQTDDEILNKLNLFLGMYYERNHITIFKDLSLHGLNQYHDKVCKLAEAWELHSLTKTPDRGASILQRPLNYGISRENDVAHVIGKITGAGFILHSLVDMEDGDSLGKVSHFSGKNFGIITNDSSSQTKVYEILYSNMDENLTNIAVENVLKLEQFGSGNMTDAGEFYDAVTNNCNDYTGAVIDEYEKLWKEYYCTTINPDATEFQTQKAWREHFQEITAKRGEKIEFE